MDTEKDWSKNKNRYWNWKTFIENVKTNCYVKTIEDVKKEGELNMKILLENV